MKRIVQWVADKQLTKRQMVSYVCVFGLIMATMGLLATGATRRLTVFYNSRCQVVHSLHAPDQALQNMGIPTHSGYDVRHTDDGTVLRVGPELRVSVTADGMTRSVITRTDRVENVLAEMGIVLSADDLVLPARQTILSQDTQITVQRVTYREEVRNELISFETVYEPTETLPVGSEQIKSRGLNGNNQVTYCQKFVDGQLVSETAVATLAVRHTKAQVVLKGTAPKEWFDPKATTNAAINSQLISKLEMESPIAVDQNGVPLSYKQCIKGLATAYSGPPTDFTAMGTRVQVGYVAVDPKEIPYGTMLFIRTPDNRYIYGVAKAMDTGGFISGPVTVDLFFTTEEQCERFGVRNVEIYVL